MKKSKKGIVALRIILYSLLAIFASLIVFVSFRPAGFNILGTSFNFYTCMYGNGVIPNGSCVITDKTLSVENGDKVAFYENSVSYKNPMSSIVVGLVTSENVNVSIHNSQGDLLDLNIDDAEVIVWRINNLGNIISALYQFRFIVIAFFILVLGLIIVIEVTAPNRKHKRYKRELIKSFEFYGDKYRKEDDEIDF